MRNLSVLQNDLSFGLKFGRGFQQKIWKRIGDSEAQAPRVRGLGK